jgi:hypothetical protein
MTKTYKFKDKNLIGLGFRQEEKSKVVSLTANPLRSSV